MSIESTIQGIMAREIIPSGLFNRMLEQARKQLGWKPRVTEVNDRLLDIQCQGKVYVEVHEGSIEFKGQESNAEAAWLQGHPVLEDTIQFQSSVKPINIARLAQTVIDASCAAAGCNNGANCALKRPH